MASSDNSSGSFLEFSSRSVVVGVVTTHSSESLSLFSLRRRLSVTANAMAIAEVPKGLMAFALVPKLPPPTDSSIDDASADSA